MSAPTDESEYHTSKRRRVDEAEADPAPVAGTRELATVRGDGDGDARHHVGPRNVPAAVWARALSAYLPYGDVRSCSASCRLFGEQVAPLIDRLYVLRSSELHAAPAKRYPAVKELYVYSLTSVDSEVSDGEHIKVDSKTAGRVVHFATSFPKLDYMFLGGYSVEASRLQCRKDDTRVDMAYSRQHCTTENCDEIFRGLLWSCCAAYSCGALPQVVCIDGVLSRPYSQFTCFDEAAEDGEACRLCQEICATFPAGTVFGLIQKERFVDRSGYRVGDLCISDKDRLAAIANRPGGLALLQHPKTLLRLLVPDAFEYITPVQNEVGAFCATHSANTLDQIRLLCEEYGHNPKEVDTEHLMHAFFSHHPECANDEYKGIGCAKNLPLPEKRRINKKSILCLQSLGFELPLDDMVVID